MPWLKALAAAFHQPDALDALTSATAQQDLHEGMLRPVLVSLLSLSRLTAACGRQGGAAESAHMAFLVDNLQYYLQADVLEVQWATLLARARGGDDFEELTAAHEACLAALHAQCFMQASSVSAALHQIFQLCLVLCQMLADGVAPGAAAEASYRAQFATVSREFSRQSAFLFAFLSNMSSPQQSPHLAQLLLRLNFNNWMSKDSKFERAHTDAPTHGMAVR